MFEQIPKVAYFYWGSIYNFSWLRYLTVWSFHKFNPDWDIVVYMPSVLCKQFTWSDNPCNKFPIECVDCFGDLKNIPRLCIETFDMKSIDFKNNIGEVHKSDIIRIWLLATKGGFWSDLDILYYRPLSHINFDCNKQAYFCHREAGPGGPAYHSIGFLAGAPGNKYFTKLLKNLKRYASFREYQGIGSYYYSKFFKPNHSQFIDENFPGLWNFDIDTVYPIRDAVSIFKDKAEVTIPFLKSHSIGVHWYAGGDVAAKYQEHMSKGKWNIYDNIIGHLIREYIFEGVR